MHCPVFGWKLKEQPTCQKTHIHAEAAVLLSLFPVLMHSLLLPSRMLRLCCCACSLQAAQSALEARNARYKVVPLRQSTDDSDDEEISDRVKDRLEQAERAVEKFVTRRLKAVQPGLEKVNTLPF